MALMRVSFVLLREGSSDDGLIPHLRVMINDRGAAEVVGTSRDYHGNIAERVQAVLRERAPVDLIFVHRDADADDASGRLSEIDRGCLAAGFTRYVPIVPIQELEAWLLLDEAQIRAVVGRPSGRVPLALPAPRAVESLASPKERLREGLLAAAEVTGRRREKERAKFAMRRATLLERLDISGPVRGLSAWQRLESDLDRALASLT